MGRIYYLMGKSASGKDRIYTELLKRLSGSVRPLVLYTTRPIRAGEIDGQTYYFVDEAYLARTRREGRLIECRSYDTVCGVWSYFTADDGQLRGGGDFLGIGTLESYRKLKGYFGEERLCPLYIEVEDGVRLERALRREQAQKQPKYAEMCRRFLADADDFSESRIEEAGIAVRFKNNELEECIRKILAYVRETKEKNNSVHCRRDML